MYITLGNTIFVDLDLTRFSFREVMEMSIYKMQLNALVATKRFVGPSVWPFLV